MRDRQAHHRNFEELSKYIRRSPQWYYYPAPAAAIMALDYHALGNLVFTVDVILLSYVIVNLGDIAFARITKFEFPARRVFALNFLSLIIWNIFFWAVYGTGFIRIPEYAFMLSISSVALLRSLMFYTYYSERTLRAIIPSLNYTYAAIFTMVLVYRDLITVIPFLLSSIIYVVGGVLFARASVRAFKQKYNESPIKIINFFLNYRPDKDQTVGQRFMERLYRSWRKVPVKVLQVLRESGEPKVTLVFPYVHPGPFGILGSSDLPRRLQEKLPDIGTDLMVFHTTTTNSNNCAGEEDIDSIAMGVREALQNSVEIRNVSRFKKISAGKYTVAMQRFGDFGMVALVPEREPFDDVSLKEGLKIMSHLKKAGLSDSAVIDAQNNYSQGARELEDCSSVLKPLEREIKRLQPKYEAEVGYCRVSPKFSAMGKMGIQALVIRTGGRSNAYVLTDSNNIVKEAIEAVRARCSGLDSVEVYTTDNHIVNASTLDMNPLGMRDRVEDVVESILEAIRTASSNLEKCRFVAGSSEVKVRMGDENTFNSLKSIVFYSLQRAKVNIMITVPSSVLASLLIFRFLVPFF
ncbi:DUF2070 family protein [Thermogymnomonas acidicola]|uniref:DUF2070 family protein n=1 Tax=Thermogymnomonas acidicola TaxID=399579 RepID=UPI00166EC809|nr:DUF2070 family protein [Thermogymnomonas acidicola]